MTIDKILSSLSAISPWFIGKILILILLVLYIIFALVLNRQVTLMNQVLFARFSPVIKFLAVIHLLIVIGVFVLALLFL